MYDLTLDAINHRPNFYPNNRQADISLDKAKDITKNYFKTYYDFNSKLKQYELNVDKCKNIFALQKYIENAAVKGLTIKSKINLAANYKNNK
tara:strand:+ start:1691 stop:1966 length:276 start_codon:yes stop_codon:yes gene_type:complete